MKVDFTVPDLKALSAEGFVADMHFHSRHSQDCRTPVQDVIKLARRKGIHVAFTDHNKVGAIADALKFKDAPVIPGVEMCSSEGKEVIAYFHDAGQLLDFYERRVAPWMRKRNDALRGSKTSIPMRTLIDMLSEEECIMHLPHPFGPPPRRSYTFFNAKVRASLLGRVHSVEVFNQTMTRRANLSALGWAVQLGKGIAGGSDGHELQWLGGGVTVSKATTIEEHLKAIARGKAYVIGKEMKQRERVRVAQQLLRTKLRNGIGLGLKRGLSLPRRAFERVR